MNGRLNGQCYRQNIMKEFANTFLEISNYRYVTIPLTIELKYSIVIHDDSI